MQSRASVVSLNWGKMMPASDSVSDRRESASPGGSHNATHELGAAVSTVSRHLDACSDLEAVNATVEAYNEAAFRYFLKVEEKRFLRSNKRFLLLLVDVRDGSGNAEDLDPAVGRKLFAALWPCVRETDFVGWYRQGRVIGVACTQVDEVQGAVFAGVVADRFQKAIQAVPEQLGSRVQMRSYFIPSSGAERS